MEISPSGKYAIMQRNTVTVLLDVTAQVPVELPTQFSRVVLSKVRDVAYAFYNDGTLVALDLFSAGKELWRTPQPFKDISILRVSDDDTSLLVVDDTAAVSIDTLTGQTRGSAKLASSASYAAFLPGDDKALVVGHTVFTDHKPLTPVTLVDLTASTATQVFVPNCEAPISVLPDGSRALLSPRTARRTAPPARPRTPGRTPTR